MKISLRIIIGIVLSILMTISMITEFSRIYDHRKTINSMERLVILREIKFHISNFDSPINTDSFQLKLDNEISNIIATNIDQQKYSLFYILNSLFIYTLNFFILLIVLKQINIIGKFSKYFEKFTNLKVDKLKNFKINILINHLESNYTIISKEIYNSQLNSSKFIQHNLIEIISKFSNNKFFFNEEKEEFHSLKDLLSSIQIGINQLTSISDAHYILNNSLHAEIRELNDMIGTMKISAETSTEIVLSINERIELGLNTLIEMRDSFNVIEENAKKMKVITSLIQNVSDRVNLLALNASIESARAGEYGLGFSVVASEIGKLASETDKSTKTIVSLLKKANGEIERGSNLVDSSAHVFNEIQSSMVNFKESIDGINSVVDLQFKKRERIKENTNHIDEKSEEIYDFIRSQKSIINKIFLHSDKITEILEENLKASDSLNSEVNQIEHSLNSVSSIKFV